MTISILFISELGLSAVSHDGVAKVVAPEVLNQFFPEKNDVEGTVVRAVAPSSPPTYRMPVGNRPYRATPRGLIGLSRIGIVVVAGGPLLVV